MPLIETTLEEMRAEMEGDWPGGDWMETFKYAGGPASKYGYGSEKNIEAVPPGANVSTEAFGIAEVAEIIASVEGENDGPEWVAVGRLRDGRWFAVWAGCDYTGWG